MSSDDTTTTMTTSTTSTKSTLQLELSLDDVNLILESLGALPFARVYGLIGRIQEQARAQLASEAEQDQG
jgi:hypothetical protein